MVSLMTSFVVIFSDATRETLNFTSCVVVPVKDELRVYGHVSSYLRL